MSDPVKGRSDDDIAQLGSSPPPPDMNNDETIM